MTLEETFKALKSAFAVKSTEADAYAKEISALKASVETLTAEKAEIAEKLSAQSAIAAERDELAGKVEQLSKALAEADKLKTEAVSQIESAGKMAAKIAASVGVVPVEINPAEKSASAKSSAEIWEEYIAIEDNAKKQAFYNANRKAILEHLNIK